MDSTGTGAVAEQPEGGDAAHVGNLYGILQAHMDRYGVRESEVARRLGTSPQTINSWKTRGVRALPSKKLLRAVANLTGTDYLTVLVAALLDTETITRDEGLVLDERRREQG